MDVKIKRRTVPPHADGSLGALHKILRRVYHARGVLSENDLKLSLSGLQPYQELKGITQAVDLLEESLKSQRAILVVGDFDADGATSTAVAVRALRAMGAQHVTYLVPNRFEYGYGLTPEIVALAAGLAPHLIITVDNGISSIEGVTAAKKRGIKVLITDHHLAGQNLPSADAIVNPNQPGDAFPSKALAGVGVIFYVMMALRTRLRENNWFKQQAIAEPNLAAFLDIVALGTVADVVALDYTNRILVAQGLSRIRKGLCCEGIRALIAVSGRRSDRLTTQDLGFALAPRVNAAGRLEDMALGIECLLTNDPDKANELANALDQLNQARKSIGQEMEQQAYLALQKITLREAELPLGLCLYQPDWY